MICVTKQHSEGRWNISRFLPKSRREKGKVDAMLDAILVIILLFALTIPISVVWLDSWGSETASDRNNENT
jgi:hypothetical protein